MAEEGIQAVTMPKWGLSMTQGKVVGWLVAEGDRITKGMALAEVETDKATGEVESAQEGVLRAIVAGPGDQVLVGGTIALVAPPEVPEEAVTAAAAEARNQLASPEQGEEAGGAKVATVAVDGHTLAYGSIGEGPEAVVLVHGFGGDKDSWLFVQDPVADGRTVYALDLPGHGASDKDVGDASLDHLARTVVGFLDQVGVERAHLVGHSLGGAVVAAAGAAAPSRVASLTLVAPAGFGQEVNHAYLRGFAQARSRRELKPWLSALFADDKLVTRQLVDDLLAYKRLDGVDAALAALVTTLLDGDVQAIDTASLLAKTSVPTVVVWGREDQVLPVSG
ncbi:MAG TPA: acetoin dehydrogenase dihydrolipoyllysine-residue acetyltransferase subunit, partial [Acidimicrobiales bacterium]|nr:acetoin dehydrogenase dihydrolipoyllysine-residue acetyltransferase subunit [Acidimicrobiales bacterium]